MERMSINQFVNLVKEMRKAQKEFIKSNTMISALSKGSVMEHIEKRVDKAISDRDVRLFDEEDGLQQTLF